jgi:CheY-like chemotaxis protein
MIVATQSHYMDPRKMIDVLIVEDSPAFNHLTKVTLKKSGLECCFTELTNGQKALEYMNEATQCPDVILLDINMPVMDGFDFLEEYRHTHKCLDKTLIYMLTSSVHEQDKVQAHSFGIVKDFFEKPITEENVARIMRDLNDMP